MFVSLFFQKSCKLVQGKIRVYDRNFYITTNILDMTRPKTYNEYCMD